MNTFITNISSKYHIVTLIYSRVRGKKEKEYKDTTNLNFGLECRFRMGKIMNINERITTTEEYRFSKTKAFVNISVKYPSVAQSHSLRIIRLKYYYSFK